MHLLLLAFGEHILSSSALLARHLLVSEMAVALLWTASFLQDVGLEDE